MTPPPRTGIGSRQDTIRPGGRPTWDLTLYIMSHRYDDAVARHYAAFRPPLHEVILARLVSPSSTYGSGLDVGCGTGRSALALAHHCRHVTALDPSTAMLQRAVPHPRIRYLAMDCAALVQTGAAPFACITFAGSLCYAKGPALRAALPRLLAPGGDILVYDFEVLLDEVDATLGFEDSRVRSDYDHALGLDGWPEYHRDLHGSDQVNIDLTAEQLAHLVLSDSDRYQWHHRADPAQDLLRATTERIEAGLGQPTLRARIYYARFHR